jgi:transposase-like protein
VTGHAEKMGRKQEQAIAALLTHGTIEAAAKTVGIGEATLRRWLKDPGFRTEYRAARRQAMEQATAQLQQLSSLAANALKEVIEDSGAPHASRVAASRAVFEIAQRGVEIEDLADRLAVLEAAANSDQEKRK